MFLYSYYFIRDAQCRQVHVSLRGEITRIAAPGARSTLTPNQQISPFCSSAMDVTLYKANFGLSLQNILSYLILSIQFLTWYYRHIWNIGHDCHSVKNVTDAVRSFVIVNGTSKPNNFISTYWLSKIFFKHIKATLFFTRIQIKMINLEKIQNIST